MRKKVWGECVWEVEECSRAASSYSTVINYYGRAPGLCCVGLRTRFRSLQIKRAPGKGWSWWWHIYPAGFCSSLREKGETGRETVPSQTADYVRERSIFALKGCIRTNLRFSFKNSPAAKIAIFFFFFYAGTQIEFALDFFFFFNSDKL